MIVKSPYLEEKDNKLTLRYNFELEDGSRDTLWFEFEERNRDFIVRERSDAGLIGLLILAMKNNEDIMVEGVLSEKLYYSVKNYLIPALNLANEGWHKVDLRTKSLDSTPLNSSDYSGTGLSCGIDSLSTIYTHDDEFKITHFVFSNAGSHGDFGGVEARENFRRRLEAVRSYPDERPLITIDSNISEILGVNFQLTHTLRNISCILNLQKLFKRYCYSSANRFENFKLKGAADTGKYDTLLLPLLSTESTTFYSSVSQYTRVERTEIVSRNEKSYGSLNVCTAPDSTGRTKNCSTCFKCLRTQLTLELLGRLDRYQSVFDLEKYHRVRDKYIGEVLHTRKENSFSSEIYELMQKNNYRVNLKSHLHFWRKRIKSCLGRLSNMKSFLLQNQKT